MALVATTLLGLFCIIFHGGELSIFYSHVYTPAKPSLNMFYYVWIGVSQLSGGGHPNDRSHS